ncbi:hypothetical protein GCM10020256_54620 [Streptomyces thermocoprophilus]
MTTTLPFSGPDAASGEPDGDGLAAAGPDADGVAFLPSSRAEADVEPEGAAGAPAVVPPSPGAPIAAYTAQPSRPPDTSAASATRSGVRRERRGLGGIEVRACVRHDSHPSGRSPGGAVRRSAGGHAGAWASSERRTGIARSPTLCPESP